MKTKKKSEILFGVPPEELRFQTFTVHKSPTKDKKTFTISPKLLDTLWLKGEKIQKIPQLVINVGEYKLTCILKKAN